MLLHTLKLNNFKGVRSFALDLRGRSAKIYADNALGKTTIMDAYIWLLTGKDHLGRSDLNFNIKTLDAENNAIPMLDHSVCGVFEHEGKSFELMRNFKEVWVKKKGSNVQTFSGHKTEYFVNDVPKSEAEYSAFVDRLIPSQLLKLLIMPSYFNEQLKAEERRKMLLEMCGDVDEAELLDLPQFEGLAKQVSEFVPVADLKKSKAAQKTKLNEDIRNIPVQINVHMKYLDADGIVPAAEEKAIAALTEKIEALTVERAGLYSGEAISKLRKELAELETEQAETELNASRGYNEKRSALNEGLGKVQDKHGSLIRELARIERLTRDLANDIKDIEAKKAEALGKYHETEDSEYSGDTQCPTCGQEFPAEYMERVKAQFNEQKAKRLEEIVSKGKKMASEIEAKRAELKKADAEILVIKREIDGADTEIHNFNAQMEELRKSAPTVDTSLAAAIEAKKKEIEHFKASIAEKESAIITEIQSAIDRKSVHEQNISKYKNAQEAAKSIEELKAKEKKLAAEYEECEGIIALCDEFTNAKVKMLDDKISGFFRRAQFKLTETLVNGGLREICDTLVDGVPYSAANNAARINIDLDISDAFSRHYGVSVPVFVDNAESVTALEQIDTQIIQLIVSEADKQLRVEVR
jgi:hypothetical protein